MLRPNLAFASAVLILAPVSAMAHPGHLGALAGHDHWVAGAAIGLAIALGLYGALKGKKSTEAEPDEAEEDAPEETPA
ncbi:DUF6732 family protein [Tropicimonas sp. S265A]|uniref:DUF6732 family protein n=1 Tax=Tropicimonas sp. S265A TaxID=3415134 RepID=UPI003C79D61C